ncbi:TPA_asm: hypothetical protein G2851_23635 [Salmonella enterica subsp. enterica serovar Enteritidis]|nr:hypothetical protein [Salmonella enterica subsp. enterica serovar Enteritidis]
MPTIESRLKIAYLFWYDHTRKMNITVVKVFLDDALFIKRKKETTGVHDSHAFAHEVRYSIMKEWPTCQDQTSSSELQYRKTIASSCGRLKVRESLS